MNSDVVLQFIALAAAPYVAQVAPFFVGLMVLVVILSLALKLLFRP